jgi:hypothetical protein
MFRLLITLAAVLCSSSCLAADTTSKPECTGSACKTPMLTSSGTQSAQDKFRQLMEEVEKNKTTVADDETKIAAAKRALDTLTKDAAEHRKALDQSQDDMDAAYHSLYPPRPTSTQSAQLPPTPAPPVPVPVKQADVVTLTMISNAGTAFACPACDAVRRESLDMLKAMNEFTELPYTNPRASSMYPSVSIPRWVLTHSDGRPVEKKVGYLSSQQLKDWIGGK